MQKNVDRGEGGLAVSGHPFQCGLFKRGESFKWPFYHHLRSLKIEK